eukprot:g33058.t1
MRVALLATVWTQVVESALSELTDNLVAQMGQKLLSPGWTSYYGWNYEAALALQALQNSPFDQETQQRRQDRAVRLSVIWTKGKRRRTSMFTATERPGPSNGRNIKTLDHSEKLLQMLVGARGLKDPADDPMPPTYPKIRYSALFYFLSNAGFLAGLVLIALAIWTCARAPCCVRCRHCCRKRRSKDDGNEISLSVTAV